MASAQELIMLLTAKDAASAIIGKVGRELDGLGKGATVAKVALAGLSAGVTGAAAGLGIGIKAAGDLQQSVANISTIKPDIDTSAVFASLNSMQAKLGVDAKELGDSLYNVFSS